MKTTRVSPCFADINIFSSYILVRMVFVFYLDLRNFKLSLDSALDHRLTTFTVLVYYDPVSLDVVFEGQTLERANLDFFYFLEIKFSINKTI